MLVAMRKIVPVILYCLLIMINVCLIAGLKGSNAKYPAFDEACMLQVIRNQNVAEEDRARIAQYAKETEYTFAQYLYAYYYSGSLEQTELEACFNYLRERYPAVMERQVGYLDAVWSDGVYFPIPAARVDAKKEISFMDSWMQSRSYGGDRGHEGCDIMAACNERGVYPVVSISDGVIEQMGWLEQGGYRIGVRGASGAYFYYAHLSDYAENLCVGDSVMAGELLAFMGDTGYSKVEGTTGNFDVHLHFGIYLNDETGKEFSVNSYALLRYLEQRKLVYDF